MKKQNAITLIALIITIILMLILAGVVIGLTLGKNGLIKVAVQANKNQTISKMKEELVLALHKLQLNKIGEAVLEDVTQDYIDNEIEEYNCNVKSNSLNNAKLVTMLNGEITGKFLVDENLNITEVDDSQTEIEISYIPISRDEDKLNILITMKENKNGIAKIKCPNELELVATNKKEIIAIDYKVEAKFGTEYNFKILLGNGEEIEKMLIINKILYAYTGSEQALILESGNYKMECYGARGGNGYGKSKGGYGGYVCGTTSLSKDTQLYLYIGQAGQDGNSRRASFNGGAIGGADNYGSDENGGSGGGATDIRLNQDLSSRIIVAGGGGGAGRMALVPWRSRRNNHWAK